MEIYELHYFLNVANTENVHQAAKKINVSPASLSKAVSRLETELAVKLFYRENRHIKLTEQGRILQKRAVELLNLHEAVKWEIQGQKDAFQVNITGTEILLAHFGVELSQSISNLYPKAVFEFIGGDDESVIKKVLNRDAHIGLITSEMAHQPGIKFKKLADIQFHTFAGKGHPLFASAKKDMSVKIEEVLNYSFATPQGHGLGEVGKKQSWDGWRDDRYPRKILYRTSGLQTLERLLVEGKALAHLPDYLMKDRAILPLKISDCAYTCHQRLHLVYHASHRHGWINQIIN